MQVSIASQHEHHCITYCDFRRSHMLSSRWLTLPSETGTNHSDLMNQSDIRLARARSDTLHWHRFACFVQFPDIFPWTRLTPRGFAAMSPFVRVTQRFVTHSFSEFARVPCLLLSVPARDRFQNKTDKTTPRLFANLFFTPFKKYVQIYMRRDCENVVLLRAAKSAFKNRWFLLCEKNTLSLFTNLFSKKHKTLSVNKRNKQTNKH